jgi:uncharacterized protein YndB with AHSA1/START domain
VRLDISMEQLLPAPIERVWHALTDSQMISRWLMSTEGFEATVGSRFTLREESRADCCGRVECEILELSAPHRMVWSWSNAEDPGPSRLVIELEAHSVGTRLTLRHTGEADERTVTGTTEGWTRKLGALAEALAAVSTSQINEGDDDG